jgi:hypothetical protein
MAQVRLDGERRPLRGLKTRIAARQMQAERPLRVAKHSTSPQRSIVQRFPSLTVSYI